MNLQEYITMKNDGPFDNIVTNGGYCGIFRKIACVGDSLSSGEFESLMNGEKGYHDYMDYSWGQFIARDAGCTVYNFSRGGMTAREYCESFADSKDFWNIDYRAQAYIIALGVNDMYGDIEFGTIDDIDPNDYRNNKKTFVGYYGCIIQRYKEIQPKAKFFLMTMPVGNETGKAKERFQAHAEMLYKIAELLGNCYVIDLNKYAPSYDDEFRNKFYLAGHLNAMGYRLTALMIESYIDWIIRNNMEDFKQIGFVGTPYYNENEKW